MKDLVKKLQGYTDHLLRFFLELLERYAFLEPMLFQKEVTENFNSVMKGRGFTVIQYSLFFDCIQGIAKITMDKDERTPSIENIMKKLNYQSAQIILRKQFRKTEGKFPEDADEAVRGLCKRLKYKHDVESPKLFDNTYNALLKKWESFKYNQPIQEFIDIRNKLTAHLELRPVNGSYHFTDISKLGLKWGDLGNALSELKPIVHDLNLIIKNTDIDIEYAESEYKKLASVFWTKDNTVDCS